jgi:two-component system, response regulator PdtaR
MSEGVGNKGSPLVLVVEDSALVALNLEAELTAAGFQVLGPAYTVSQALALLAAALPDFAVLDFNLAGEPVTQVAARLRELGVPFVLTSAYPKPQHIDPAFDGAINLGKPLNTALLIRRIATTVSD